MRKNKLKASKGGKHLLYLATSYKDIVSNNTEALFNYFSIIIADKNNSVDK